MPWAPPSASISFPKILRKMKLRVLSFAALLMVSGLASAAPQLQTCEPMEVTHSGGAGIGYSLSCEAGPWRLNYKGSVPAGSASVLAQYRVTVTHPDGTNLVQARTTRLAEPSQLGQSLLREAVLLDNGNLAMRDCQDIGCTLYRPLGGDAKLAKATITVTPEMARLLADRKQLTEQVDQQAAVIAGLQAREAALSSELQATQQNLDSARTEHSAKLLTLREEQAADLSGLESSYASKLAAQRAEDTAGAAGAQKTIDDLTAQVQALSADLAQTRDSLSKASAATAAGQAELADAHTARQDLQAQLVDAVARSEKQAGELATATAAGGERERALIQAQAEIEQAKGNISALTRALAESDTALVDMTEQRNAALVNIKTIGENTLEVLDRYDALKSDYDSSQTNLQAAQKDAADLYAKLEAAKLTQDLSTQAASVAHMEVDSLNLQVQGLTAELAKAIEVLAAAKKETQAYQAEAEGLRSEHASLEMRLEAAKQREAALEAQLKEASDSVLQVRAQVTEAFNDSGATVQTMATQVDACRAAVTALETTNQQLFDEVQAAREKLVTSQAGACAAPTEAK